LKWVLGEEDVHGRNAFDAFLTPHQVGKIEARNEFIALMEARHMAPHHSQIQTIRESGIG
jgi:hypothetical protein